VGRLLVGKARMGLDRAGLLATLSAKPTAMLGTLDRLLDACCTVNGGIESPRSRYWERG